MIQIAAAHGMKVYPCGEGTELACYGADCNGCMTQETYEKSPPYHAGYTEKSSHYGKNVPVLWEMILEHIIPVFMDVNIVMLITIPKRFVRIMLLHDPKSPFF